MPRQDADAKTIATQMQDAHQRTLALIAGLDSMQMRGPLLSIINPLLWEIGHVAYFYEYWVLRQHLGRAPIREDADRLYDSISIAHDDRWNLPLPTLESTLAYIEAVYRDVKLCLLQGDDTRRDYLARYAVFHHDMHNEAFTYTRQTLSYPAPVFDQCSSIQSAGVIAGDARVPGGLFMLGAPLSDDFVFDNEKWAHPVALKTFSIARAAVSNADFLAFVEAGGYTNRSCWDDEGWVWRENRGLEHPLYWSNDGNSWQIRQFDQWIDLPLNVALIHVSWYEAQAYCRWAGRRLPTEAEWEAAASAEPDTDGLKLSTTKRHFPWGDEPPEQRHANLDGFAMGTVDVSACPDGDSAFGCRQMIGNVWEWTQDRFEPYPGFTPDMYQDYSQPLFGNTRVLRGGAWTTRSRMIRNTWRTYYGPERNDVFAGFRTCAL
jgi:gamma-glutamyl hercynylcysteine S-oxide synthase